MTAVLQPNQPAPALLADDRHGLALKGFFAIVDRWGADNRVARKILGNPAERTFYDWKRGRVGRLPDDTLRRIGYVAGIWKALQIVYADPALADSWPSRPNAAFGGQTPLARMAAGDVTDLAAVRAYLDAARAPWS
ncbi:antitoxin Xre/MbcA/ParS toxin-binding domain-containing protein [Rhodoplanes azumiensis]|uniref:Antitoxin Xre/MbcA/ParS toxin-binding domain-containing protein n=1 Tax=Rhodoplanes azumiensis TaxID=1897628 RepID=A0ABW5AGU7_9BRAD